MTVEYPIFADLGIGLFFMILAIIFLVGALEYLPLRRTQKYRKELTDLYVAGKIKQLAEKDGINLEAQYELFKKWQRLRKREDKELDNAIEEDIKEKIGEEKKDD